MRRTVLVRDTPQHARQLSARSLVSARDYHDPHTRNGGDDREEDGAMAVRKVMRDVEQHLEEQLDQEAIELGLKIRALRKSALLSARQLAEQIGVSRSLIAQIERGAASPSLTTLRRIADRLGVPVAALFLDSDEAASGDCDRTGRQLVVRADQRRRLHTRHTNVTYMLLTPDVNRKMGVVLVKT
jgi:transcriptional regulator with XRE-family HTH domain/cation transport regulator ChaB